MRGEYPSPRARGLRLALHAPLFPLVANAHATCRSIQRVNVGPAHGEAIDLSLGEFLGRWAAQAPRVLQTQVQWFGLSAAGRGLPGAVGQEALPEVFQRALQGCPER